MATGSSSIDEYTDYSCSTSVERLARDVETLLRSWHVVDGSDRHVSISSQTPLLASKSTSLSDVHLIRSDQLVWHISYTLQDGRRMSCQMDLELALWDGPSRNDDDKARNSHLPYSLCRPDTFAEMPLDLFSNFSSLFGIGQHISLTPVNTDLLPPQVQDFLSANILTRHDTATTAVPVLASVLSGWLQTALNVAATASHCCLPVFGVWGRYQPPQQLQQQQLQQRGAVLDQDQPMDTDVPPWIQASQKLTLSSSQTTSAQYGRRRGRQPVDQKNGQFIPPLLTGQLFAEDSTTTFWCSVLPAASDTTSTNNDAAAPEPRLSAWGSLLLGHCDCDTSVSVWGARHVFVWSKPDRKNKNKSFHFNNLNYDFDPNEWRMKSNGLHPSGSENDMTRYRLECGQFALRLLEEAIGATAKDPLWGPPEDPVSSIHATLTWSGNADEHGKVQPLLALPLKARSKRISSSDWQEMEEGIEGVILDPSRPTKFTMQTRYDHEMAQASLATHQRCVLAALIRTATLPTETLMCHLSDEFVIENWDSAAGNVIASALADEAGASMATHSLVAAMDWTHAAEDMIERWQAEEIVRRVLDGTAAFSFPSIPAGTISAIPQDEDDIMRPLLSAAPPGRLLSLLFVEMARVRSPSSMALVWNVFVEELRCRLDSRQSLPNMNHVPGLDPPRDATNAKRCFSSSGINASFSATVGTEPDTDHFHCLIGQKLQVC
jgi:hypothetical protein